MDLGALESKSGTHEMLENMAAEHIQKKDVALVRTWPQKALHAVWGRFKKEVGWRPRWGA